jgi:hypothetical protein
MRSPEITFDQPITPSLAVRGFALAKKWSLFGVAVLLPGGSLIALGLWLYSRHKSGKPLVPHSVRTALISKRSAFRSGKAHLWSAQTRRLTTPCRRLPAASPASCRPCS